MARNVKHPPLKGSDIDTETAAQARKLQPGAQGFGTERDAIRPSGTLDRKKLRRNRRRVYQPGKVKP